jgi:hypothetical protein
MPDGVVSWIEPSRGRGAIKRGGYSYGAELSDIEPATRHVGWPGPFRYPAPRGRGVRD